MVISDNKTKMGLLPKIGMLVVALAVSIGLINKFVPHWFLLMPGNGT